MTDSPSLDQHVADDAADMVLLAAALERGDADLSDHFAGYDMTRAGIFYTRLSPNVELDLTTGTLSGRWGSQVAEETLPAEVARVLRDHTADICDFFGAEHPGVHHDG